MKKFLKCWKAAGNYVIGRSHESQNGKCQDRVYFTQGRDIAAIALSDGAGSCSFSEIGAEIVTQKICELFQENFHRYNSMSNSNLTQELLDILLTELRKKAQSLDLPIKELSCTLLFVCVKNNRWIMGHIGDGVIGQLCDGFMSVLSAPFNEEFANTTSFITSSNAGEKFKIKKGDNTDKMTSNGFVLSSDGPSSSLYNTKENKFSKVGVQMLQWFDDNPSSDVQEAIKENIENFFKPKTHDDCSLCMMKKVEKSIEEVVELPPDEQKSFFQGVKTIQVFPKYIEILKMLSKEKHTVKEMMEKSGIPDSSLRRYLSNLRVENFVMHNSPYFYLRTEKKFDAEKEKE